ncbi:MAG: 50S ribosomal protein L9, partial [Bacteroidales bacterium]|nr:50S ribosomal protein L9 [Bacteroidales bacterium]
YTNDIVTVKSGYARNYLIPKKFAISANEANRKVLAENLKQKSFKEEKIRNEANDRAKLLNGLALKIGAKVAASGKIFGSVNDIQLAEAIKTQHNFDVDRKTITIKGEAIKEIGTYKAEISIYKDIKAEISFEVIAE